MRFRAACIQTNSGDDIAANIAAVTHFIHQAAEAGAQLIALPENAFYMADPATSREAIPHFTPGDHPGILACRTLARELGVWILAGSVAVEGETEGKRRNRSVLIDAQGSVTAEYDKIHLFDVDLGGGERYAESARFEPGRRAALAKTPWGSLGMTVCYDVRFPHLYRALAKEGAEILAVPAAFTARTGQAHWHVLLRARAIENACYVIAPAQCGTHPGERKTFGHSLIVDPWGEVLADGGTEPGVTFAEIDLAKVAEVRRNLPSLTHDRSFSR